MKNMTISSKADHNEGLYFPNKKLAWYHEINEWYHYNEEKVIKCLEKDKHEDEDFSFRVRFQWAWETVEKCEECLERYPQVDDICSNKTCPIFDEDHPYKK
jgi:hypothetical protein